MLRKILLVVLALFLSLSFFMPAAREAQAAAFSGSWYYRFGDASQLRLGSESWVQDAVHHTGDWHEFPYPHMPQSISQHYVWVTTTIADTYPWRNYLMFRTDHESVEIWQGGKLLYSYGALEPRYLGYGLRWHMVKLRPFQGETQLTFRVYSDLPLLMQPLRDCTIGRDVELTKQLFINDAIYVAVLPVILFFLLLLGLYYFSRSHHRLLHRDAMFYFALMAGFILARSEVRQLCLDWPVFWKEVGLICLLLLPLSFARLVYDALELEKKRTAAYIMRAYGILAVAAIAAEFAGFQGLEHGMFSVFLLRLAAQPCLGWLLWESARWQHNLYSMALLVALVVLYILSMLDGLNLLLQWWPGSLFLLPLGVYALAPFVFLLMRDQLNREQQLASVALVLEAEEAEAVERSETDPLTGCLNRNAYEQIMAHVTHQPQPHFSLIMLDIDYFKHVNDTFGHDAGDTVLRSVTQLVRSHLQHQLKFFRWGGEEFVIYCPDMSLMEAAGLADLLRQSVAEAEILEDYTVTISLGVARWRQQHDTLQDIFRRLDGALYQAKQQGRNRVEVERERR